MSDKLIAKAESTIYAPIARVWDALVTPADIKQYMFGTDAISEWREGSHIIWKGEWQGKPYEDKGVIHKMRPGRMLQYSHFSPLSGEADEPENYHTITIDLSGDISFRGPYTHVVLTQDKNATEEDRKHSEENWGTMLSNLKKYLES